MYWTLQYLHRGAASQCSLCGVWRLLPFTRFPLSRVCCSHGIALMSSRSLSHFFFFFFSSRRRHTRLQGDWSSDVCSSDLIPWVYRRAAFHAISDSTRDDLVRRGISRQRVEVIYPGVDAAWYSPDGGTPRAGAPTFLYVGRLKRYKGVETAVRALALARAERPDVTLEIAGQGDDRARLERLVRALGQVDAVRFLGFVPDEEKRRLLRRAWAGVLPSLKEGWGISNVEAAACGTPALASDSPGLRESVRHGETGFLVPHGDERALADRMF